MTHEALCLLAVIVRVWAIVRVQPWLRSSVGLHTDVFAIGLAVAVAGLTSSPAALAELASRSWDIARGLDVSSAAGVLAGHPEVVFVEATQVRTVLVGALLEGTVVGIAFGLVSSAWIAVVSSPLFALDLFSGRFTAAFVTLLAALAALLVIDVGAHHVALRLLFEVAEGTGMIGDAHRTLLVVRTPPLGDGGGLSGKDFGTAESAVALVSLTLTTTMAFVVSAGFPLLVVDVSRQSVVSSAPLLATASELLGSVLRPALLLLWIATAFTAMPSAWVDAFLGGPWRP